MSTLICVLCCMAVANPMCTTIDNLIIEEYDNVIAVHSVEYGGKYLVGIENEPFFLRSDKNKFVSNLKTNIASKCDIPMDNIKVVFDLDTIYHITQAKCEKDIKLLLEKQELL